MVSATRVRLAVAIASAALLAYVVGSVHGYRRLARQIRSAPGRPVAKDPIRILSAEERAARRARMAEEAR